MKKLICVKDIEELYARGEQTVYICAETIVTPAARDAANGFKMRLEEGADPDILAGMDSEKVYKVFKILAERGMLKDIFKPYEAEVNENGLKLVKGNTVSLETLETGKPGTRAYYREVMAKDGLSSGFLEIEDSIFDWEVAGEELNYVIEGSLSVTVKGRRFTANPGDVLHFPNGTKGVWEAKGKVKIFYAVCID